MVKECAAFLAALLVIPACGARTGLSVDDGPDASDGGVMDAPMDVPPDAPIPIENCVEVPFGEPPTELEVSFVVRIAVADVVFLIDTTGSMMEEISGIQRQLRAEIIPGLRETIPDVQFGVASFADFPVGDYGASDDLPFISLQRMTGDVGEVERAINRLTLSNGSDGPESQTEALYQVATGDGVGRWVDPQGSCGPGELGYLCLRPGSVPIVLVVTDAESHNGTDVENLYDPALLPEAHGFEETVGALNRIGAKVLGVYSGNESAIDVRAYADETGATRPDGQPIVVGIDDVTEGIAEVVTALVEETPIDIDLSPVDVPGDVFDGTEFVSSIRAVRAEPPSGATLRGEEFERVRPGTRVWFTVELGNERLPTADSALSIPLDLVFRSGATQLGSVRVVLLVPGPRGETCDTFP